MFIVRSRNHQVIGLFTSEPAGRSESAIAVRDCACPPLEVKQDLHRQLESNSFLGYCSCLLRARRSTDKIYFLKAA